MPWKETVLIAPAEVQGQCLDTIAVQEAIKRIEAVHLAVVPIKAQHPEPLHIEVLAAVLQGRPMEPTEALVQQNHLVEPIEVTLAVLHQDHPAVA